MGGPNHFLGLFDKAEDAAKAYDLRAYRDPRIGHSLNLPEVDYSALPDEMARPSDLTAQLEELERAIYDAETAHLSDEWGNILAGWKTLEDSSWSTRRGVENYPERKRTLRLFSLSSVTSPVESAAQEQINANKKTSQATGHSNPKKRIKGN